MEIATVERIPVEAGHVARAGKYMRQGAIRPFIGGKYPLAEIQRVHGLLESGEITGRAVMVP